MYLAPRTGYSLCVYISLLLPAVFSLLGQTAPNDLPSSLVTANEAYTLGPGDSLELRFTYTVELNEKVAVRPDGAISLPVIGEVPVAGITPDKLSALLTQKYAQFYKRPEVIVIVREFAERRVYVGGEVFTPGVVVLKGTPLTCLQAIVAAGGAKPTARLDGVVLLRHTSGSAGSVSKLDLKRVMRGGGEDISLKPYDVVLLPRTKIAKVNIFVEQYVNGMLPRNIVFPYNLNSSFTLQ